jgi:hypothetical protein
MLTTVVLYQRKMMSALVLSCRTGTPPEVIDEASTFRNPLSFTERLL